MFSRLISARNPCVAASIPSTIFDRTSAIAHETGHESFGVLNFAGWAKKITGRPTITVGSAGLSGDVMGALKGESSSPQDLDELTRRFERGDFDLVAVGRALLQDPLWAVKVKEGRNEEIEPFAPASFATYY
jgi:2,4-dienoyl-CoA reductase-like NADH-dependent reductase (Old Yellow Enzyme family)